MCDSIGRPPTWLSNQSTSSTPTPPPCPKRGPWESQIVEGIMGWKKMERGTLNLYMKSRVHPRTAHMWKDSTGYALRTQLWCRAPVSSQTWPCLLYSERDQSNTAKALKTKLTLESHIQKADWDCKLSLTELPTNTNQQQKSTLSRVLLIRPRIS